MKRSNYCGALRSSDIGREVVLQGWVSRVRDLGGLSFLDLRDREGLVQVVLPPEAPPATVKGPPPRSIWGQKSPST